MPTTVWARHKKRYTCSAFSTFEEAHLVNYADTPGGACSGPDSMVADVEGNVYMAMRCEHRPGIGVFSADGKELALISTGKELPTNVGFGLDADANLLYMTSGNSLYRIRMAKAGYHLPAK